MFLKPVFLIALFCFALYFRNSLRYDFKSSTLKVFKTAFFLNRSFQRCLINVGTILLNHHVIFFCADIKINTKRQIFKVNRFKRVSLLWASFFYPTTRYFPVLITKKNTQQHFLHEITSFQKIKHSCYVAHLHLIKQYSGKFQGLPHPCKMHVNRAHCARPFWGN